jgi:phytoene dehydrogenase-like protein
VDRSDVVIVGGGLAGLTAAVTAAQGGARVTVLEARSDIGGRARTTESNGFLCNEGPHALYKGAGGMAVLEKLGVRPNGGEPPTKGHGLLDGRLGALPSGPASLLRTPLLSAGAKFEVAKLLSSLGRIRTDDLADVTVGEWIDGAAKDKGTRLMLHALVRLTTFVNAPDVLSAKAAIEQVRSGLDEGVLYLHGGWQTLVDGLAAQAFDASVAVRQNVKVERIATDGALVVETNAGSVEAGAVVIAAGGPSLAAKLTQDASLASFAESSRQQYGAVLDVGLLEEWGDHPGFVLGLDQPVYLSVHSNTARVSREGTSLVSVHKYLPGEAGEDDRAELEGVLDVVRPGWRAVAEHVAFSRQLVPMTHIPSAAEGGLAGRPDVATSAPNVFIAGDWVGPKGLLGDAAIVSGHRAGKAAAALAAREGAPSAA